MGVYLTGLALIAVVSWFVARPFLEGWEEEDVGASGGGSPDEEENVWRKQKNEALAAIREAEFDFHLGKLSEADYREMRRGLEARALEAMRALEGEGRDRD